ncbi:MAG: hypothetical protein K9L32_04985 [Chromatiaceae bacterium]|nr:hypothetical protein [Chromatiaceae bacterium]MCF8003555.1 hypothetical protein [Chromatiaceae bacterium]MCF8014224.1 hypothetical protein [Chromatiaceae bacterium]
MTVGLLVTTGALGILILSLQAQNDNIKLARLNQDLRAMLDIMVRDIRRAGFVTNDPENNHDLIDPNSFFSTMPGGATTEIAIYSYGAGNANCFVYAYNRNLNDTVDSNERYGFRLANNGELEMRRSGDTNENCSNGSWETLTEPEVEITGLSFVLSSNSLNVTSMMTDTDGDGCLDGDDQNPNVASNPCDTGNYGNGVCNSGEACNTCTRDGSPDPACLSVRSVNIVINGRLRGDESVTQTLSEQVRIRNDRFIPAVP